MPTEDIIMQYRSMLDYEDKSKLDHLSPVTPKKIKQRRYDYVKTDSVYRQQMTNMLIEARDK